jgi:pimeloyl-ACP methyl ester carboxylesterase
VTPTLVLLPPLGHDAHIYDALAATLAPHVEVVALDYPLADLDLDAPDLLAELARRLLPAIAARTPALLGGISLGATLCYLLAPHLPLRGLLLMAPGGPRVAVTRREGVLAAMADLGDEEFVRRHLGGDTAHAAAACALLRAALAADLSREMTALIPRIDLVWGTEDRLFNAGHIEKVRRLLPAHRFHPIEGAGHYVAREAPDRVAEIVRSALQEHP